MPLHELSGESHTYFRPIHFSRKTRMSQQNDRRQRARKTAIACAEVCRDAIWAWYAADQPPGPVEMDFLVDNIEHTCLAFADAEAQTVIKVPAVTHPTLCYRPQPLLEGMARCTLPKQHTGKCSWQK